VSTPWHTPSLRPAASRGTCHLAPPACPERCGEPPEGGWTTDASGPSSSPSRGRESISSAGRGTSSLSIKWRFLVSPGLRRRLPAKPRSPTDSRRPLLAVARGLCLESAPASSRPRVRRSRPAFDPSTRQRPRPPCSTRNSRPSSPSSPAVLLSHSASVEILIYSPKNGVLDSPRCPVCIASTLSTTLDIPRTYNEPKCTI